MLSRIFRQQPVPIKWQCSTEGEDLPMRKRFVFAALLLSTCGLFEGNGVSQEAKQTQPQTQEQSQSRNRPVAEPPTSDARPHLQSQPSPDEPATNAGKAAQDASNIDVTKLPLLDQARYHAAEFMNDLPNFV